MSLSASVTIFASKRRSKGVDSLISKKGKGDFSRNEVSREFRDISSLKWFSLDWRYGNNDGGNISFITDDNLSTNQNAIRNDRKSNLNCSVVPALSNGIKIWVRPANHREIRWHQPATLWLRLRNNLRLFSLHEFAGVAVSPEIVEFPQQIMPPVAVYLCRILRNSGNNSYQRKSDYN